MTGAGGSSGAKMPWELTSRFAFASQNRLMVNKHLYDKGKGRQLY